MYGITVMYFPMPFLRVQQQKQENRMDSKNLALVFTPSLMRSPNRGKAMDVMQKLPEEKKALDMIIQNYNTLFT